MITEYDNEFQFGFLTEGKCEEAADLMTEAFLKRNQIWKELKVPYNEARAIMKARIYKFCTGNLSVVFRNREDNELAMIGTGMDLIDYLQPLQISEKLGDWSLKIKKLANELEGDFFGSLHAKRGEYIYGDIAAVKDKYLSRKGIVVLFAMALLIYKQLGYKAMFGRISNPVTLKILSKIGVEVMKRVQLEGSQNYMELIKVDLLNMKLKSFNQLYPS